MMPHTSKQFREFSFLLLFLSPLLSNGQSLLDQLKIRIADSIALQELPYPFDLNGVSLLDYALDPTDSSISYLLWQEKILDSTSDDSYPRYYQAYRLDVYRNEGFSERVNFDETTYGYSVFSKEISSQHQNIRCNTFISYGLGRGECGASEITISAIRRDHQIITLPSLEGYCEGGEECSSEEFITPTAEHENEIWVKTTYSTYLENSTNEELVFYECVHKYQVDEHQTKLIASCRLDESMRVNAENGLNLRNMPFLEHSHVMEVIPDGAIVKVIAHTGNTIAIERNGEKIQGEWYKVEYTIPSEDGEFYGSMYGYVLNIYLEYPND